MILHKSKLILTIFLSMGLFSILGCQSFLPQSDSTGNLETPAPTDATPKPLSAAADFIASDPTIDDNITLRLWTVEQFSPQINLINETLSDFETENPNIHLEIYQKNSTGQASALSYFKVAPDIAPNIMPDAVILRADQLPQAWQLGVLQPLSDQIPPDTLQDFLPAAKALATVNDTFIGIPLEMNVTHLVANSGLITPTPMIWQDVISNVESYRFPAKSQNGALNANTLVQYLDAGGTLVDETNQPTFVEESFRAVLTYYQTLLEKGIIAPDILDATTPDAFWTDYKNGKLDMTLIDTHTFLADRHQLHSSQVGSVPTRNGTAHPIVDGWVIAMVTPDPLRQQATLRLMESFVTPEANAAWTSFAQSIPVRQSSFDLIAGDDPYWAFLADYLDNAIPMPAFSGYDHLSRIMQHAIEQVIKGEATVDEALQRAIEDMAQ